MLLPFAAALLALTACGTQNDADDEKASDGKPVEAWNTLAKESTGFFKAASTNASDAEPTSAKEAMEMADYDFVDGVTLGEFYSNDTDTGLCFTGQDSTYLTFASTDKGFQRTLGTGDCDFDHGDIVLSIDFEDMLREGEDKPNFDEKVVEGKDLAKQVPALEDFLTSIAES